MGLSDLSRDASGAPYRIDVHHHLVPPAFIAEIGKDHPIEAPSRNWSPARSIEDMDRAGVATAVTSITAPGLWFGHVEQARRLARACNEYAADLSARYPRRFRIFACLPLPDIDGSLAEIDFAFGALKADGIALFTHYGDKWLGDPAFSPVFEELNRRGAVVYTHPITSQCAKNLVPDVPPQTIEYGTDTARAIASFVFSGSAFKYSDIRIIFSHAGGTMPFLVERFENLAQIFSKKERIPNGVVAELKRFYYDTAQSANPAAMGCLKHLVDVDQIVFGTDFPYRTAEKHVTGLRKCDFSDGELRAIERDNAVRLMPGLGHCCCC
jgi:predicted TIM-barrel fold metal-dependent hydrolase